MARIKNSTTTRRKKNRVLKLAKGYVGARSKQYRVAKQSVMRALSTSFSGRKERKRQFRSLWIARINAAARINGISYSKFMYFLLNYKFSLLPYNILIYKTGFCKIEFLYISYSLIR